MVSTNTFSVHAYPLTPQLGSWKEHFKNKNIFGIDLQVGKVDVWWSDRGREFQLKGPVNEIDRWPVITSCQSSVGDMEDQGVRVGAEGLEVYSCRQSLGQIYDSLWGQFCFCSIWSDFLLDLYWNMQPVAMLTIVFYLSCLHERGGINKMCLANLNRMLYWLTSMVPRNMKAKTH